MTARRFTSRVVGVRRVTYSCLLIGDQGPVDDVGQVALEGAGGLGVDFALGEAPFDVVASGTGQAPLGLRGVPSTPSRSERSAAASCHRTSGSGSLTYAKPG